MSLETEPRFSFAPETYHEHLDLDSLNNEFAILSPTERIKRAGELFPDQLVLPNTFGPTAPIMLKLVTEIIPDIPVVSIRHGYETDRTLELADWYTKTFDLDLKLFESPKLPIPPDDTIEFEGFQRRVKVETFQQMLSELKPLAYFSGVMHWQTPERENLPFIQNKGSVLAINPVVDLTEQDVADFFEQTGLPVNDDYFDPTKGSAQNNECKLNTSMYK